MQCDPSLVAVLRARQHHLGDGSPSDTNYSPCELEVPVPLQPRRSSVIADREARANDRGQNAKRQEDTPPEQHQASMDDHQQLPVVVATMMMST
jgi:hypothetical protein